MFTAIWRKPFNSGAQERSKPSSQHWEGDSITILLETGCYPSKKKKKTFNNWTKYPGQLGEAGAQKVTLSEDIHSNNGGVKCGYRG